MSVYGIHYVSHTQGGREVDVCHCIWAAQHHQARPGQICVQ